MGLKAYEIAGDGLWNATSGFDEDDGGLAQNGTQAGPNWLQLEVAEDGTTYTLRTSADGSSWDDEFTDVVPDPFGEVTDATQGGIACFFDGTDTGSFSVAVTLWIAEPAVADLWTPAEISTLLWLDADDAATFTFSSGVKVSQWNDKSGNGNHVNQIAQSTWQPDYTTNIINGLPVVRFDGTTDRMEQMGLAGWPANNATAVTVALVYCHRSVSASMALFDISSSTTTNNTGLAFVDSSFTLTERASGTGNSITTSTNAAPKDVVILAAFTIKSNKREIFVNGTLRAGPNTVDNGALNYTNFRLGALFQDVFLTQGDFAELVIVSGDDDTTRQLVEGYLAWKWNTVSTLDAGHPYKSAAPTV